MILYKKNELRKYLKKVNPCKIAVAYIGNGFDEYIDTSNLSSIIISPTLGTTPRAVYALKDKLGSFDMIHFLSTLHAKLFIGKKSCMIGSTNLSQNAFGDNGNFEIGIYIEDKEQIVSLHKYYEILLEKSAMEFPDEISKNIAIERLEEINNKTSHFNIISRQKESSSSNFSDYPIDSLKLIYLFWYQQGADYEYSVDSKKEYGNGYKVIQDSIAMEMTISPKDKIKEGRWALNWRVTNKYELSKTPKSLSWMYIHKIIKNGCTEDGYEDLAIEFVDKEKPPFPFELNQSIINNFGKVIKKDKYKSLSEEPNKGWTWKSIKSTAAQFYSEWKTI